MKLGSWLFIFVIVLALGISFSSSQVIVGRSPTDVSGVIILGPEEPTTGGGNASINQTFLDNSYARLDGGNTPFTGQINFSTDVVFSDPNNGKLVWNLPLSGDVGTIRFNSFGGGTMSLGGLSKWTIPGHSSTGNITFTTSIDNCIKFPGLSSFCQPSSGVIKVLGDLNFTNGDIDFRSSPLQLIRFGDLDGITWGSGTDITQIYNNLLTIPRLQMLGDPIEFTNEVFIGTGSQINFDTVASTSNTPVNISANDTGWFFRSDRRTEFNVFNLTYNGDEVAIVKDTTTISFGSENEIPTVNAATDDYDYSPNLLFDGNTLRLGGANAINISSLNNGNLTIGGIGNTNNENIILDFESTSNVIQISSTTGVNRFNFDGTWTISSVGASDTLSINPDANLNLGTSQSDRVDIGRGNTLTSIHGAMTINSLSGDQDFIVNSDSAEIFKTDGAGVGFLRIGGASGIELSMSNEILTLRDTNTDSSLTLDFSGTQPKIDTPDGEIDIDSHLQILDVNNLRFRDNNQKISSPSLNHMEFQAGGVKHLNFNAGTVTTFNPDSVDQDFNINWNSGVGLFIDGATGYTHIPDRITHTSDTDTYLAFFTNMVQLVSGGNSWIEGTNTAVTVNSGSVDMDTTINWNSGIGLKVDGGTGNILIGDGSTGSAELYVADLVNPVNFVLSRGDGTSFSTIIDQQTTQMLIEKISASGSALIDINPKPLDGTSSASFRFFRTTVTSGTVGFVIFIGDGTSTAQHFFSGRGSSYMQNFGGSLRIGGTGGAANSGKFEVTGGASTFEKVFIDGDIDHNGVNIGVFSVTPVNRAGATEDIKDLLVAYGWMQGTSASNLDLDLGELIAGRITNQEGRIFHRIGTATSRTILATDHYVGITSTLTGRTMTLPADHISGTVFIFNDETGGANINNIIIATADSDTINDVSTVSISAGYGTIRVISDGVDWWTW